ncbi:hypothetical protein KEM55_006121 [Ascosphaera atra]|nr:hypothetical protein KEM55_006121 [Ascosphaera atra]
MGKLDLTDHSPIERSSPLKKSTKPTEPDTEMRAAPPAAANLKKEKGDVKAATPVPLHPPLAPSAAAAAAPFVSAALKTPLVSTTEISAKLDTNRLDVLVAVATGEARAN